jgi:hypothetical protein
MDAEGFAVIEKIVAAVAGGFLGWLAVEAVRYFVLRSRLIKYLVVQANTRLRASHINKEWLGDLARHHSSAGVIPQIAPRYSADHAEDLHESRDLILRYLTGPEIERVAKFLDYLWEAEYLTEGVCEAIGGYARNGTALTADECAYIQTKVTRVTSIVDKWPRSIKSLGDLPIDYAGVKGPGDVPVPPK